MFNFDSWNPKKPEIKVMLMFLPSNSSGRQRVTTWQHAHGLSTPGQKRPRLKSPNFANPELK
jgi:hypothetical protein